MKRSSIIVALLFIISACAEPLPQDRLDYVGKWQSPNMAIMILADGTMSYKKAEGNSTTSVSGPIQEFKGDSFMVGFLSMTTTFEVSKAPHEIDGEWKMTVDGVELTRVSE